MTIDDNSPGKIVVKNVKIDDEAHRKLRIKAAQLECNIGDLASIVVTVSLEEHSDEELKSLLINHPLPERQRD